MADDGAAFLATFCAGAAFFAAVFFAGAAALVVFAVFFEAMRSVFSSCFARCALGSAGASIAPDRGTAARRASGNAKAFTGVKPFVRSRDHDDRLGDAATARESAPGLRHDR